MIELKVVTYLTIIFVCIVFGLFIGILMSHNRIRQMKIESSNNKSNPNKNKCTLAVAEYLGCENNTKYLHDTNDVLNSIKWDYSVKKYKPNLKGCSVELLRYSIQTSKYPIDSKILIFVEDHVLLLDNKSETIVDTAPTTSEKNDIEDVYVVYKSPSLIRKWVNRIICKGQEIYLLVCGIYWTWVFFWIIGLIF